jgi:hypothetical protein
VTGWATLADRAIKGTRAAFGAAVSYTPASTGVAESITAPFDAQYQRVEMQGELPVTATRPMLGLRLADLLARPAQGDRFVVGGLTYEVTDIQDDGHGAAAVFAVEVR